MRVEQEERESGEGGGGRGMQWGVRLERPAAETFSLRTVLADCHTPTPGLALFPVGRTDAGKREAWTSSVHKERADRKFTSVRSMVSARPTLQALVYGILPSTTAVFSYAIGSRKLSAERKKICWCSNSSKFVTNNSYETRRVIYNRQQSLHHHK